ncbi:MAG: GTP-binding protein [Methylophaga sp.]|nr:GTP-binding protein [Methylophaga sp.]
MSENNIKIIFTGSIGTGTKTAMGAITDVVSSKVESISSGTAVAHGILLLDDGKKIHLYGILENWQQVDFKVDSLNSACIGLVLLLDNAAENPITDLKFFLDQFDGIVDETNIVIGVIHMSLSKKMTLEDYRVELKAMSLNLPLFEVDIRQKKDISLLVQALLNTL